MKKIISIAVILYMISYLCTYLAVLGIIMALDSQISGMFRVFILYLAAVISGYYLSEHCYRQLKISEKILFIAPCVIISVFFDNAISLYFDINKPPIIMGGFYFLILVWAYRRILKIQWIR